ncbi:MAG: hypothetical protein CMH03_10480 [Marinovum sp.]|nr:hypothetical protein [Marinovum sp.]|tara:strand:+ start:3044 stop:3508 length:465 start_codon:yes stop_codon:yes gene_type:complete
MSIENKHNPDGTTTIKIVKILNGTDIVCVINQAQQNSPLLTLDKPLEIKYVPQITNIGVKDYIALVKWAAYTNDQLVTIPKDKILTITNASDEMIKSYTQVIGEYNMHDKLIRRDDNERTKRLMDREMMSENEMQELEEIFDSVVKQGKKKTIH